MDNISLAPKELSFHDLGLLTFVKSLHRVIRTLIQEQNQLKF